MACEKCSKCQLCQKSTHRTDEEKKDLTKRMNIIEGQIRGVKQMIEDDRYCSDILIQLSAINKAVESLKNMATKVVIKEHRNGKQVWAYGLCLIDYEIREVGGK